MLEIYDGMPPEILRAAVECGLDTNLPIPAAAELVELQQEKYEALVRDDQLSADIYQRIIDNFTAYHRATRLQWWPKADRAA